MSKRFKTPAAIQDEIWRMRKAEDYRRQDRATISDFYNGAPPLTQEEAEALGITVNVNHLFGYTQVSEASEILEGLYNKPAYNALVKIELDAAPPGKGSDWGIRASQEASRVLRGVKSFRSHYKGVAGDAALHGEALFFYPNRTCPLPRQCPLSKMLIPDESTTDTQELASYGIQTRLSLADLTKFHKHSSPGWNKGNVGKVLAKIFEGCCDSDSLNGDSTNFEELEYRRQENSANTTNKRSWVDATYFYQQRPDKEGLPYDLTVMLNSEESPGLQDKASFVLYEAESAVTRVGACLHPIFMDCMIGGERRWHRVLGPGTLNFQINQAVELLVCRAQQATYEGSMNLWRARDTTTREALQQILLQHNGILPEGVDLVPNRFEPNFSGMMEMIQFFRQAGAKNVRGSAPNTGDNNDVLEVQAMAELNTAASSSQNRIATCYDYLDGMYDEAVARLTNPFIEPHDAGYSEVMDFQNAMKRFGIPLHYLQRANVRVTAVRIVGNGVRSRELEVVNYLSQNRQNYAPEAQPRITRMCTALATSDANLAEELTPIQDTPDVPQEMRAKSESAIMLTTRQPEMPKEDDIDETHVIQHFPALELLITDAMKFQNGVFTPQNEEAFSALGGHILAHIERIESKAQNNRRDADRELASKMKEQVNELAAMAEKLIKNREKQQAEGGQEQDPMAMAEMQHKMQTLQLQREKLAFTVQKFTHTQNVKEQQRAFDEVDRLHASRREDERLRLDKSKAVDESRRKDFETAHKIVEASKKPAPASK